MGNLRVTHANRLNVLNAVACLLNTPLHQRNLASFLLPDNHQYITDYLVWVVFGQYMTH